MCCQFSELLSTRPRTYSWIATNGVIPGVSYIVLVQNELNKGNSQRTVYVLTFLKSIQKPNMNHHFSHQ